MMAMDDADVMMSSQNERIKDAVKATTRIGDRATSDVVVRLRTHEGTRDHWFYCHSEILTEKSKYFADRLSENWPTCQILDSRNCVDVYCEERDFDFHVCALRLFYEPEPHTWYGVKNVLGILQVAVHLGCDKMAHACMDYLEAAPWDESEEEEIVRTIPHLGPPYEKILARLHPVDSGAVVEIFISTLRFATSSLPVSMRELLTSCQEQLEYMLTEDDDSPLLKADNSDVKTELTSCMKNLLVRFDGLMEYLFTSGMQMDACKVEDMHSLLSDISWFCQILSKMEMMKDFVHYWVKASEKIVVVAHNGLPGLRFKVVEIVAKVLDAICLGNVIVPTTSRIKVVKIWLAYVQRARPLLDEVDSEGEQVFPVKLEAEVWQNLEASFVSLVLTLPSNEQADILSEWLRSEHIRYPDLTEAFEVWCYRSKLSRRRLAFLHDINTVNSSEAHAPVELHSSHPCGEEEDG